VSRVYSISDSHFVGRSGVAWAVALILAVVPRAPYEGPGVGLPEIIRLSAFALPLPAGGILQALILQRVGMVSSRGWLFAYAAAWGLGGLFIVFIPLLFSAVVQQWPEGIFTLIWVGGAALGGAASSIVLRWGMADFGWSDACRAATVWGLGWAVSITSIIVLSLFIDSTIGSALRGGGLFALLILAIPFSIAGLLVGIIGAIGIRPQALVGRA